MEETQEQSKNSRTEHLKPWQWKKGQSGNPGGRPKGKSLKTYAREMLEEMTPEERQEFFNGLDKKVIWEMAEGKPDTQTDITSGGDKIVIMPPEVIDRLDGRDN